MEDYHAAEIRTNLEIFARETGVDHGDVMALKVRQTLNPEGATSNRYLHSGDYDELATELDLPARTVGVYQG